MPKGSQHVWTAEELEQVMRTVGGEAHARLAYELDVETNTIYSIRKKVKDMGGIQAFLDKQRVPGSPLGRRQSDVRDQIMSIYLISVTMAGRGDQAQYTVTIPSSIGKAWIERFGRQVKFVPCEEGLLIMPVHEYDAPIKLPEWLDD